MDTAGCDAAARASGSDYPLWLRGPERLVVKVEGSAAAGLARAPPRLRRKPEEWERKPSEKTAKNGRFLDAGKPRGPPLSARKFPRRLVRLQALVADALHCAQLHRLAGQRSASVTQRIYLRGFPVRTSATQPRSTSTATDRCSRLTESTSFTPDLILTTIPVKPRSGPPRISATLPTCMYGQGMAASPLLCTRWIAAISSSSTGIGVLPTPTICITPGVISTVRRLCGFIRQNKYPGNNGTSINFVRSDQRRVLRLTGKKHSYPAFSKSRLVLFSLP